MSYLIISTAGHVDHGKTTLIKALTGIDTDNTKEEKQREMSINLGFAFLKISEAITASIIDVPGHEKFLKNMLVGTGAINLVLFVVAADEGIMPQSILHLNILNLYEVNNGIIVINKIDKVNKDHLIEIKNKIKNITKGTFLEKSTFCEVSALNGIGIKNLRNTIKNEINKVKIFDCTAPFRLCIDRIFSVKGHGVVVTGSILTGLIKIGDIINIYPLNRKIRVKGLELHGEKKKILEAGQRAAINLANIDLSEIQRGMILSSHLCCINSYKWYVFVKWVKNVPTNTRVRLHIGTEEYIGRIYLYKGEPVQYCHLILEKICPAGSGDRGILRMYSPQELLGAILIISSCDKKKKLSTFKKEMAKALINGDIEKYIKEFMGDIASPMNIEEIKKQTGYISDEKVKISIKNLIIKNEISQLGKFYVCSKTLYLMTKQLKEILKKYHQNKPEQLGLSREIVRQKLQLKVNEIESFFEFWGKNKIIEICGAEIALTEHKIKHSSWQKEIISKAEKLLVDMEFNNVTIETIEKKFQSPLNIAHKIHELLVKDGILIYIQPLYFTKNVIDKILYKLQQNFEKHKTISVSQARDLFKTSRKITILILENFDMKKYTIREKNIRIIGMNLKNKNFNKYNFEK